MRRVFGASLGLLVGYPVFAFAGYWAIALFSSNGFDRSVEAARAELGAEAGEFLGSLHREVVRNR